MALWVCAGCTAAYAVGAPRCPQCSSTEHVEEGAEDNMPKITVHGGPSNAADDAEQIEGSEQSSAADGTDSSASSEKQPTSDETSKPEGRSHARMTASRSRKARTGSSSAGQTDGDPTAPTSATASADTEEK